VNVLRFSVHGLMLLMICTPFSAAQSGDEVVPLKVTVCDLYREPQKYAGKMIELRATIVGHGEPTLEEPAFSPQEGCSAAGYMIIALEFPQNVRPKPGFHLEKDSSFQKYEEALRKPNRVEATLEGRFDPVFVWQNKKRVRVAEGEGFGKKHSADARLVLRRMSQVEVRYIPRR
jgi:hypothetical protein